MKVSVRVSVSSPAVVLTPLRPKREYGGEWNSVTNILKKKKKKKKKGLRANNRQMVEIRIERRTGLEFRAATCADSTRLDPKLVLFGWGRVKGFTGFFFFFWVSRFTGD